LVLVTGGYHDYTGILTAAELYDPATGNWSGTADMNVNRYGHTATRLTDGRVLAVGGFSTGDPASAELYANAPPPPPPPPVGTTPSGTSLLLQVVDGAGNPIAYAAVSARDSLFPTDSSGHLLLEDLTPGRFLARVDALGFTSASIVLELPEGAHLGRQVKLLPYGEPIPFEASLGGVIETPAVRVTIPANAVVDALGRPVTGTVEVTVVPLDPTTQLAVMPGPLEGTSPVSGRVQLESLFMAEVSLWSEGAPVQLAPGASATLEFVLPDALASQLQPGDTVPAWWFDPDAGLWREEGVGTIQVSASGKRVWVVEVKHFTWWNCDYPVRDESCVDVLVVNDKGVPVPYMQIEATGIDYSGSSMGSTFYDGRGCIFIRNGRTARISVAQFGGRSDYSSASATGSAAPTACGSSSCTRVTLVGPSPICVPGAYEVCPYKGPEGTKGRGLCRAGRKQCSVDGMEWSACRGEVLPVSESCRGPFDDDCDGTVNEDCSCSEMAGLTPCYTGPAGTKGIGQCHGGLVGCGLFGDVVCVDQRLPRPDDCSTLGDDNCDGVDACPVLNQWFWSTKVGSSACPPVRGWLRNLAMDGAGNALVLGSLDGTYDFGGTPLTTGNGSKPFVAKFDANGVPVWALLLGGMGNVTLTVDRAGNVLLAGSAQGALHIGGLTLEGWSGRDLFVVKLSPGGTLLWAQRFESQGQSPYSVDEVHGLSTDPVGNVAITGKLAGPLRIGGVTHFATEGDKAFYVAKLDASTGEPLWSRSQQHDAWLSTTDATLDEAGNVVLVAGLWGPYDTDSTSSIGPHVFVAKFDGGTGSPLWGRNVGSEVFAEMEPRVKIDATGKVWVVAWRDNASFFLAKLDTHGGVLARKQLVEGWGHIGRGSWNMTFEPSGNLLLSGWSLGTVNFGGGQRNSMLNTAFVAWYDAKGAYIADRTYQPMLGGGYGAGSVKGHGIAVDASGHVLLGGDFHGAADFGDGLVSSCGESPFLLKFDPTP
jgi:hypothetical protein